MCTTCGTLAGWRIFWWRGETRREQRGVLQSWGFSNTREGDTHKHTQLLPNSSFFYLEPFPQTPPWSRAGSCVLPEASSPLRRRDTSPDSACLPVAALGLISGLWEGGKREREREWARPHRSVNTHPLPMQTWASRLRLNKYLDGFHRAAASTSLC